MAEEEKKLSIALPGEWALQKAFGPALTEIGEDLKRLYAKGRDKIIAAAYRKLPDPADGKQANLRVTRDVLWNGAFTDDEVCAEYFGGILATSRSESGKDDDAIQFVDVIKSMSSRQLRLHYVVYHALNKQLVAAGKPVNVALSSEIHKHSVCFVEPELRQLDLRTDTDLNILHRQGLISQYSTNVHVVGDKGLRYALVHASTFGVLLYAVAHNRLHEWRQFSQVDLGSFPDITMPTLCAPSVKQLAQLVGLEPANPAQ